MNENEYEKALYEIISKEEFDKIKRDILQLIEVYLNAYSKRTVIDYINTLRLSNNCIKCTNYNHGRMYWICNKDHNIYFHRKIRLEYPNSNAVIVIDWDIKNSKTHGET
ncbi:hypothetical protein LCGC14_0224190 [marine sediment metagenome]|uniref:Uncharacterized protein n=1 Tax=marine sediment metagenome TaxID=412755 RepID=A0A0F9WWT5_9ZZZZ